MNRKTLLALAVAGGLGSSAVSTATVFCEPNPADAPYRACSEAVSDFGLMVPERSVTTYTVEYPASTYFVERPVVIYQPSQPRPPELRVVPLRTVTTYEYSGQWPSTEPRVSTYRYYTYDWAR